MASGVNPNLWARYAWAALLVFFFFGDAWGIMWDHFGVWDQTVNAVFMLGTAWMFKSNLKGIGKLRKLGIPKKAR